MIRIKSARFIVVLMCVLTGFIVSSSQPVQAAVSQIVLSNVPQSGFSASYNSNFFDIGTRFSVPAGDNYTLNSVSVQLNGVSASFQAYLYETPGALPGSLVSQIGGAVAVNATGAGVVTPFTADVPITLQANHTYMILLTGTGSYGLTANLPSGIFTFQSGVLYDRTTPTWVSISTLSLALSIEATPQLAPTASFSAAPTDLSVVFTDTSTESPNGWSWSFGDGDNSSLQNPTHLYSTDGMYNVCLTASNLYGSSSPVCQNVTVSNGAPTVTINQAGTQADPTSSSPIVFEVQFSEPVNGFDSTDIALSGSAGGVWNVGVSGSGSTYQVEISGMTTAGSVTVSIPAGAVQDIYGANSLASTSIDNTVTFDVLGIPSSIVPPTLPPPPPTPLCIDLNFDENGVVRASLSDAFGYAIHCRVLYQNGRSTQWLGNSLYSESNLGIPGLTELGILQAIDIFSPSGMTYFTGGGVFCLRGEGTLIWLSANQSPRHAEIIGSYTVPEFPGFTCATLFEPGAFVLVQHNPINP